MTATRSLASDMDHWANDIRQRAPSGSLFHRIDRRHAAILTQPKTQATKLIVSFERIQPLIESKPKRDPFGWRMRELEDWAALTIFCDGHTWFRSKSVYAYFDTFIDDAFFDEFDQVLFYGAGPCGYAAGAYAVSAPGASVLMISPQATLDPNIAGWDRRFRSVRRLDFTSRFGYAPDMVDGTAAAYVVYDPTIPYDAMHAALFPQRHVTHLKARHLPKGSAQSLDHFGILEDMAEAAMDRALNPQQFARMYRARRQSFLYLSNLVRIAILNQQPNRAQAVRRFMQPVIDAQLKRSQKAQQNTGTAPVL